MHFIEYFEIKLCVFTRHGSVKKSVLEALSLVQPGSFNKWVSLTYCPYLDWFFSVCLWDECSNSLRHRLFSLSRYFKIGSILLLSLFRKKNKKFIDVGPESRIPSHLLYSYWRLQNWPVPILFTIYPPPPQHLTVCVWCLIHSLLVFWGGFNLFYLSFVWSGL